MPVFNCFKLLFRRLGKDLWNGESSEYPVAIFESLRQNPRFREFLLSTDSSAWFKEFLALVGGHAAYWDVFTSVIDFLFEEMSGSAGSGSHDSILVKYGLNVSRVSSKPCVSDSQGFIYAAAIRPTATI